MLNISIIRIYASSCLLTIGIIVASSSCFTTDCSRTFPITSCVSAILVVILTITFITVNKNFDLVLKEKSEDYESRIEFLKEVSRKSLYTETEIV